MSSRRIWMSLLSGLLAIVAMGGAPDARQESLPAPVLHHFHVNAVDPARSLEWYARFWPQGKKTTVAGFPAFHDGISVLYTKVPAQASGRYDLQAQRSVPQSAFWTFGSTVRAADSSALRARLREADAAAFTPVPLFGGQEGASTAPHSWGLPMGHQILTLTQLAQMPNPAPKPTGQDYGYFVDPDGLLVEFAVIAAAEKDDFGGHSHFWHEQPACAANWYIEHLGMQMAPVRDAATGQMVLRDRSQPCEIPIAQEVTYPSTIRAGQLRSPAGNVRFANGTWLWYPRQCRGGRCGANEDRVLSRSRGQVMDHVALAYPDLDAVLAHLRQRRVPIVEGPYAFGSTRAALIEDPDGLAIELVEVR